MKIKLAIKTVAQTISAMIMLPITFMYLLLSLFCNADALISSFSQCLSLLPGKLGNYLRAGFYRFSLNACAADVVLSFATLMSHKDTDIGAGVYIGPQCNIGKCSIGKDCLLGSGVHIMSGKGQHNFDSFDTPIREQGGTFTKITIGDNCWFGNGSLVMANVGHNCIIAAGAVIISDVPDGAIVAGNPAKIIKSRV